MSGLTVVIDSISQLRFFLNLSTLIVLVFISGCSSFIQQDSHIAGLNVYNVDKVDESTSVKDERLELYQLVAAIKCEIDEGLNEIRDLRENARPSLINDKWEFGNPRYLGFRPRSGTMTLTGKTTIEKVGDGKFALTIPAGISSLKPNAGKNGTTTGTQEFTRTYNIKIDYKRSTDFRYAKYELKVKKDEEIAKFAAEMQKKIAIIRKSKGSGSDKNELIEEAKKKFAEQETKIVEQYEKKELKLKAQEIAEAKKRTKEDNHRMYINKIASSDSHAEPFGDLHEKYLVDIGSTESSGEYKPGILTYPRSFNIDETGNQRESVDYCKSDAVQVLKVEGNFIYKTLVSHYEQSIKMPIRAATYSFYRDENGLAFRRNELGDPVVMIDAFSPPLQNSNIKLVVSFTVKKKVDGGFKIDPLGFENSDNGVSGFPELSLSDAKTDAYTLTVDLPLQGQKPPGEDRRVLDCVRNDGKNIFGCIETAYDEGAGNNLAAFERRYAVDKKSPPTKGKESTDELLRKLLSKLDKLVSADDGVAAMVKPDGDDAVSTTVVIPPDEPVQLDLFEDKSFSIESANPFPEPL